MPKKLSFFSKKIPTKKPKIKKNKTNFDEGSLSIVKTISFWCGFLYLLDHEDFESQNIK